MTTTLTRPLKRRTGENVTVRDRSKYRKIVVTLYPAGYMGLRLEGTRKEETITLEGCYEYAVIGRIRRERMEKINAKKQGFKAKRGRLGR